MGVDSRKGNPEAQEREPARGGRGAFSWIKRETKKSGMFL